MLQAITRNKAGRNLESQEVHWRSLFYSSEDSLTSSVIGTLLYLPTDLFWSILNKAIGEQLFSNERIVEVEFWPSWDPKGTTNELYVEPDVFIRTKEFDLIIEAKRWDGYGQCKYQWINEITAYENEYLADFKKVIFLALGGNSNLKKETLPVVNNIEDPGVNYRTIYKCSWLRLLLECIACKKRIEKEDVKTESTDSCTRILNDVLDYFNVHSFIVFKTFGEITCPEFSVKPYKRKSLELNIPRVVKLQLDFEYLFKNLSSYNVAIYQFKKLKIQR